MFKAFVANSCNKHSKCIFNHNLHWCKLIYMAQLSVLLFVSCEKMLVIFYGLFSGWTEWRLRVTEVCKSTKNGGRNTGLRMGIDFSEAIKPHLSSLASLAHLVPYGTLVVFRGEMRYTGSGPLHPSCGDSSSMKQLHQHKWLFIGTLLIIVFLGSESCSNDGERAKQMIIESASKRSLLPLYNISFAAADLMRELRLHQHWRKRVSVMPPRSIPVHRLQPSAELRYIYKSQWKFQTLQLKYSTQLHKNRKDSARFDHPKSITCK